MAQFSRCRICSKTEVPVLNGRLAEHMNAQDNPCPGSYNVVRPRDITDDGGLGGVPVKEHPMGAASLGYEVQGTLDENAKPYPGTDPARGDGVRVPGYSDTGKEEPIAAAEQRVQRASDGSLWAFVEGRNEPVQLEEVGLCGEFEIDGTRDRICIQKRGPHEHVWWAYAEASRPNVVIVTSDDPPDSPAMQALDALLDAPIEQRSGKDRRTDEHDQPTPDGNTEYPDIQTLVLQDIEARRWVGIQRYGQGLKMFNGRDSLQDLYEELLDAAIYTRGMMEIRNAHRDRLIEVGAGALQAALERDGVGPGDMVGLTEEATVNMTTAIVDRLLDYFTAGKGEHIHEPAE